MSLMLVNGSVVETNQPKLRVEFFEDAKKIGIGKFESATFIKVRAPGVRDYVSRLATENDIQEYPAEYALFVEGDTLEEGTPLSQLPGYKKAFALELAAMGIESCEDLAERSEAPEDYLAQMYAQACMFVKLKEIDDA